VCVSVCGLNRLTDFVKIRYGGLSPYTCLSCLRTGFRMLGLSGSSSAIEQRNSAPLPYFIFCEAVNADPASSFGPLLSGAGVLSYDRSATEGVAGDLRNLGPSLEPDESRPQAHILSILLSFT
jgi:hypothetical protein